MQIGRVRRFPTAALLGALALVTFSRFGAAQPTGQVTGSVVTTDGIPVVGAAVELRVRPGKPGTPFEPFNAEVTSGPDGEFSVNAVPPGIYAICPTPKESDLLPPCVWSSETLVEVAEGAKTTAPPIKLQTGADLYVRVNDPGGKRAAVEGNVAGASLMIGVRSPRGLVIPVPLSGKESGGFDHHLFVPTDVDLAFVAFSSYYSLAGADGGALSSKGSVKTVRIQRNQKQHREVLNIR